MQARKPQLFTAGFSSKSETRPGEEVWGQTPGGLSRWEAASGAPTPCTGMSIYSHRSSLHPSFHLGPGGGGPGFTAPGMTYCAPARLGFLLSPCCAMGKHKDLTLSRTVMHSSTHLYPPIQPAFLLPNIICHLSFYPSIYIHPSIDLYLSIYPSMSISLHWSISIYMHASLHPPSILLPI